MDETGDRTQVFRYQVRHANHYTTSLLISLKKPLFLPIQESVEYHYDCAYMLSNMIVLAGAFIIITL